MARIVKNTTQNSIVDIVCPHYCKGCDALGSLLCERCKKYLITESIMSQYEKTPNFFVCGKRVGMLGQLVSEYKYGPVRGIVNVLARILDELMPEIDGRVVVVPLPTVARHVRERGFDHMWLLARKLAKIRGWKCQKVLCRVNGTVQVGASAEMRKKQAQSAYGLQKQIEKDVKYVLLDDVLTTGASMAAAESVLRNAGAKKIYKAVIARS